MSTLAGVSLYGMILALHCDEAAAAAFVWFNDPSSTADNSAASPSVTNNVLTLTGSVARNLTHHSLADVGFFVPFMWPRVPVAGGSDLRIAMPWSNARDGWFTADFNGSGTSLLVTLDIFTPASIANGRVRAGSIAADQTLTAVFGPTSNDIGAPFPTETLLAGDLLPLADLGSFQPLQSKPFDLAFTYHWGDGRTCCALNNTGADFTLARAVVPAPAGLALLGTALAGFGIRGIRNRAA